MGKMR